MQLQLICQLFDAGSKPWRSGGLESSGSSIYRAISSPRGRRGAGLLKVIRFMLFDSILLPPAFACSMLLLLGRSPIERASSEGPADVW
jgi:hypothetical protein